MPVAEKLRKIYMPWQFLLGKKGVRLGPGAAAAEAVPGQFARSALRPLAVLKGHVFTGYGLLYWKST